MAKISKAAAGYVHFENTDYKCSQCWKWEPNGEVKNSCAEVTGIIRANGGCNTYVQGKPQTQIVAISLSRKLSREEAGYTESPVGFSCKRCEYFLRDNWDCRKVDKDSDGPDRGAISPQACCNLWSKSPLFGGVA